jgi:hypothetical protein
MAQEKGHKENSEGKNRYKREKVMRPFNYEEDEKQIRVGLSICQ